MPVDQKLLDILACPACKSDIKLTTDRQGLKCLSCNRVYPIKDGIPVMLVDEAVVDPDRPVRP